MTTGSERKAKHRILDAAGYVHANGWISERDMPKFQQMIDRSQQAVLDVLNAKQENGK